jgi:RNA polymerase sigma-70 factor (ECF subfamily)
LKVFGRNARGFEQAVRAHGGDLYRYAYWLCRDHSRAEDIVQEALERAWKSWADLNDRGAAKGWLFAIARNEFLRGFERKGLEIDERDIEEIDPGFEQRLDAEMDVRRALRTLPFTLREPLMMQVLGGFSCSEIATALGTTEGAVMTRLTRARQTLRRLLDGGEAAKEMGR